MKANTLSLNIAKRKYFSSLQQKEGSDIKLMNDHNIINQVESSKSLVVIIDKNILWYEHITYIYIRISRGIVILSNTKEIYEKLCFVKL